MCLCVYVCVSVLAGREYVAGSIVSGPRESRCEKQRSEVGENEARESSRGLMNFFSVCLRFFLFASLFHALCLFLFLALVSRFVFPLSALECAENTVCYRNLKKICLFKPVSNKQGRTNLIKTIYCFSVCVCVCVCVRVRACACVFAGAPVPQPGGLQPCGEVRQPDGGHPAEAACREAPVQPGLLRHPQ